MTRSLTRIVPGALVLSLLAPGLAAQAFEGVVTWQMGAKKETMTQAYKGNQVRTEMGREGRNRWKAEHADQRYLPRQER